MADYSLMDSQPVYALSNRLFMMLCIVLPIILFSCNTGKEKIKVTESDRMELPDEIPIDYRVDYSQTDTVTFSLIDGYINASQIIEDITFIPLETKPECLIGSVGKVLYRHGKYYILDYFTGRNSIQVFGSDGKHAGSISKTGRGPGEFKDILDFDVDENGSVYLINSIDGKILVFNPALDYVATISPQVAILSLITLRDRFIVLARRNEYNNPEMRLLYILDRNGEIVESYFPFTQRTGNIGPMTSLTRFEDRIYVNMPYVPVIFSIDTLFRVRADYFLNYEYNTNKSGKRNRFETDPFKLFFSGSDYTYVCTGFRSFYSGFINGNSSLFFSAFRAMTSEGYLNPFPLMGIIEGDYGIVVQDADFLTGNLFLESTRPVPDQSDNKKRVKDHSRLGPDTLPGSLFYMISGLNENDNPVLFLVKFRKSWK